MTTGKAIRAQIDTEVAKGLILINGGGGIALLAFLPHVLGIPGYEPLIYSLLVSLLCFQFGLIAAVLHSHYRRRCSLEYDAAAEHNSVPSPCERRFLAWFRATQGDPCICCKSWLYMWASVSLFCLAGVIVSIGGFVSLFCR